MNSRIDRLEARVKAVNTANAYAREVYDKLATAFAPFVGQKIEKVDGSLLAKVEKCLPEFSRTLHVYRYGSRYSLSYVVKTCELLPSESSCVYHETSVYVGELKAGVLTKLCNPPELRSDYTVEAIQTHRAAYEIAKKAMEEARGKLHPFGEYDG